MSTSQRHRSPRQMGLDFQWGSGARSTPGDEAWELRQRLQAVREERDQARLELAQTRQALRKAEQEIQTLRTAGGPQASTALNLDRELKRLIGVCHPDKWQDAPVAVELTKALNSLRTQLQKGRL